jgi:hypothetical protein
MNLSGVRNHTIEQASRVRDLLGLSIVALALMASGNAHAQSTFGSFWAPSRTRPDTRLWGPRRP